MPAVGAHCISGVAVLGSPKTITSLGSNAMLRDIALWRWSTRANTVMPLVRACSANRVAVS